ncbi:hypothetical protein ACJX0J_033932, partial [Zea mays]
CPHRPFHSLVRSILYQQLAFKAAASVYSRFLALLGGEASVAPDAVLALSPHQLRQIGVSPRKASYLHDLARNLPVDDTFIARFYGILLLLCPNVFIFGLCCLQASVHHMCYLLLLLFVFNKSCQTMCDALDSHTLAQLGIMFIAGIETQAWDP